MDAHSPDCDLWQEAVANADRLLRWANHMTSDRSLAEEAVQNTLVAAWQSGKNLRSQGSRWAWLWVVLRRKVVDLLRGLQRSRRVALLGTSDAHVADGRLPATEQFIMRDELFSRLQELSPRYQRVLETVYAEGLTYQELANRFGLTTGNARVVLHRARVALRRAFTAHAIQDSPAPT